MSNDSSCQLDSFLHWDFLIVGAHYFLWLWPFVYIYCSCQQFCWEILEIDTVHQRSDIEWRNDINPKTKLSFQINILSMCRGGTWQHFDYPQIGPEGDPLLSSSHHQGGPWLVTEISCWSSLRGKGWWPRCCPRGKGWWPTRVPRCCGPCQLPPALSFLCRSLSWLVLLSIIPISS